MRKAAVVCLCAGMLFLIGCSFDTVGIVDHPKKVAKGEQFDVTMYAPFCHVTNGPVTTQDIIRDSVHLAVGMPKSWSAVSAKYYIAKDFKVAELASKLQDSIELYKAIAESAAVFKARAVALTPDANFPALLGGRTYSAKDRDDENPIVVATDSVGTWSAYSGEANILIVKGTKVDTIVTDSSGAMGVIFVPIFLWATLKAPANDAGDTLYYLAKTAAMPQANDTTNIDKGDMKYVPVAVGGANSVAFGVIPSPMPSFSVRFNSAAGCIAVELGPFARGAAALAVYDLSGTRVKDLTGEMRRSHGEVRWDASAVKPGMYLVQVKTGGRTVSQPVRVVR